MAKGSSLLFLCAVIGVCTFLQTEAQYQLNCSSSPDSNGRYYLPTLPLSTDSSSVRNAGSSLDDSNGNTNYIFPVPDSSLRACAGTVSAVRFCYIIGASIDSSRSIFTLFLLEERSGPTFTVTNTFFVRSTPTDQKCTRRSSSSSSQYCCDTMQLNPPFSLPQANFAYGTGGSVQRLLRYSSSNTVEHFQFPSSEEPFITREYEFSEGDRESDRGVRLLHFIIDPPPPTDPPPTESPPTDPPPTEPLPTNPPPTDPAPTDLPPTDAPSTAPPDLTPPSTSPSTAPPTNVTTLTITAGDNDTAISGPPAPGSSAIGPIAGGALGGLAVIVLLVVICTVTLCAAWKRKHVPSWKKLNDASGSTDTKAECGPDYYRVVADGVTVSTNPAYEFTTVLSTNPAYGVTTDEIGGAASTISDYYSVATDGVAVSTNPAYGITTDGVARAVSANSAYNGVPTDGVAVSTNSAYGVPTDGVAVSTNPAYGVTTDEVAISDYYGVVTDGAAVSANPAYGVPAYGAAVSTNPAYGVPTDGVAVSTNPACGVTSVDTKMDDVYEYVVS